MRKLAILAVMVMFVFAGTAVAVAAAMSIGDAKTAPTGTEVTVAGTVKAVEGNEFTLSDGAGEIGVDCGPPWYKAITLKAGQEATVTGEVDRGKEGTKTAEVEALSITTADGTITIRGAGRPPWAGGPKAAAAPGAKVRGAKAARVVRPARVTKRR